MVALADPTAPIPPRPLRAVEDDLAEVMGILNAAAGRLVALTVELLASGSWEGDGIRDPEHFLVLRCGLSRARAARVVLAARRAAELPVTMRELEAGHLTEDHVAVIARRVPAANEAELADWAGLASIPQLHRACRTLPAPDSPPVADVVPAAPLPVDRVSFGTTDDGRWWAHLDLSAAAGALVEQSWAAGREAARTELGDRATWVDAVERAAHAALDGFDPGPAGAPRPARPGPRYQVLLHVDVDRPEAARIGLGPALSAAERQAVSCDADVRAVLWRSGQPLAAGRRRRVVGPVVRAAVEARDGGCVVPGCGATRWLHCHHVVHWEDGGPTDPDNLCSLCPTHHTALHRGRLSVAGDPGSPGRFIVLDSHGRPMVATRGQPPETPFVAPPYTGPSGDRLQRDWLWWN